MRNSCTNQRVGYQVGQERLAALVVAWQEVTGRLAAAL
jgi:hypothetical protein